MSISLPGFDAWLTERLEECAGDSGENVDFYVARAVAAQMISDCERADVASAGPLKARLTQSGLSGETVSDGISSVLADPRRLHALNSTGLMGAPSDPTLDRVARTAAGALATPAAAVVLVGAESQSLAGACGVDPASPPKHLVDLAESFDKYVVVNESLVRVENAAHHPLFGKYSIVAEGRIAAYLGVPLTDDAGNTVGVLSVFDSSPRQWKNGHIQILDDLASVAKGRMFHG